MKKLSNVTVLMALAMVFSCTSAELPDPEEAIKTVIQMERDALDNWSAGEPSKYSLHMADDVSYTDDVMAHELKIGIDEVQAYLNSLDSIVPPHTYELIDPNVQVNGDVAVLHIHYQGEVEGQKGSPWKASTVYRYMEGEWKMIHANWSLVDPVSMIKKATAASSE